MPYKNPEDNKRYYLRNRERLIRQRSEGLKKRRAADPEAARAKDRTYYASSSKMMNAHKRKMARKKAWFDSLMEGVKCAACGEDEPLFIDLHHFDPTHKENNVSRVYKHWAAARLIAEINKCVPLCCKCHRLHHAGRLRALTESDKLNLPPDLRPPKHTRINAVFISSPEPEAGR